MKSFLLAGCVALLIVLPRAGNADPVLFEAAFNVDGVGYSSIPGFQANDLTSSTGLPFDVSGFDFSTGLGTIGLTISGAGLHAVAGFIDLDLGDVGADSGAALGAPAAGQSWEIDEPGFAAYPPPQSDIYAHVFGGALENANNLTDPDDVSMASAFSFVLAADEQGILTFLVSLSDPGGFRLRQYDDTGEELFLKTDLRVAKIDPSVPEPSLLLLMTAAIGSAACWRRAKRVS